MQMHKLKSLLLSIEGAEAIQSNNAETSEQSEETEEVAEVKLRRSNLTLQKTIQAILCMVFYILIIKCNTQHLKTWKIIFELLVMIKMLICNRL